MTGAEGKGSGEKGMIGKISLLGLTFLAGWGLKALGESMPPAPVKVGAAAVALQAEDAMVIGGGIGPGLASGQEGELRAAAAVLSDGQSKLAMVACDILMIRRDYLDEAARRIEKECGIPFDHVLVNATHTHHAPSTVTIHGYERDETFCGRVRDGIVLAVAEAHRKMGQAEPCEMFFRLGVESTVGQNSRLLLGDGTIFWVGSRDDAIRPTAPFDSDLPVLAFRQPGSSRLQALLFNHSTHCIGARSPGKRSPGFYGLACQELEAELGGTAIFFAGAFGSTHNLTLNCSEMVFRIKYAVRDALGRASPAPASPLKAVKKEVAYRVRRFDEQAEDAAVRSYCEKRVGGSQYVIDVFRNMRKHLGPLQGEERKTWIQAVRIGEVAWVGVPGEFFTVLGLEIKRRSPFRYTCVAGVANDYIGYIPDEQAYDLGGYQVWTGFHSFVERGTGELLVREAVKLLEQLK